MWEKGVNGVEDVDSYSSSASLYALLLHFRVLVDGDTPSESNGPVAIDEMNQRTDMG
jgi:sensor domain CHASE-containing protein